MYKVLEVIKEKGGAYSNSLITKDFFFSFFNIALDFSFVFSRNGHQMKRRHHLVTNLHQRASFWLTLNIAPEG